MQSSILGFYSLLRKVFGICDCCDEVFRLSDCKVYQKKKPASDWKEEIDREIASLDELEEELIQEIKLARDGALVVGRKEAGKLIRKIDPIFAPLRLDPHDAKVLFHPIDFIVFNGMNRSRATFGVKNVVLLDKAERKGVSRSIQESISNTIAKKSFEWITLRVNDDGSISEE